MNKIAPSILSADMGKLAEELEAVKVAGADMIHIDVMDGHFVPNLTMGTGIVKASKKYTDLPLDVHLMISNPLDFIDLFADAGADMISFHQEATHTPLRTLDKIHERGLKGGVVLAPATPIESILELIDTVDYILLLCVEPGFGNQKFRNAVLDKISRLKAIIQTSGRDIPIQVDGGVNSETIEAASKAGADIFVVGSAIFERSDYCAEIDRFRQLLMEK